MPYDDEIALPQASKPKWKPTWKPGPKTGLYGTQPSWITKWKNTQANQAKWGAMYGKGQNQLGKKKKGANQKQAEWWNKLENKYGGTAWLGGIEQQTPYEKALAEAQARDRSDHYMSYAEKAYIRARNLQKQWEKYHLPQSLPYNQQASTSNGTGYGSGYGGGYRSGYGGGGYGDSGSRGTPMYFGPGGGYAQNYEARRPSSANIPRWMALIANWRMSE